jgi:nucleotide-binding universal stress UspA family protein
MKRILLPTDFSAIAMNAMRYAVNLFKGQACTFYLLHTYTPAAYNVGSMADSVSALELQRVTKENAEREMKQVLKDVVREADPAHHHFETIVAFNLLLYEIEDVVDEKYIDLIVMGTKGATAAREVFIGTNTMYTIKKVKCPVIAVPADFGFEAPKEILFPTDFHVHTDNPYLPLIKEICQQQHSRLHVLYAYLGEELDQSQQANRDFLQGYFKDIARLFHFEEGADDVLSAIVAFERKQKINLLVMVHNQHNFFENLLFTPVIKKIAYHTNIPFLVIPSVERMRH